MKSSKGFTIIEMIVVMAVFLFIVGAALAIFISIFQQQKKVLSEQELLNQLSYVEEYMSKALRMAAADTTGDCLGGGDAKYIYLLTHCDSTSCKGIKFLNQSGVASEGHPICQEFFLEGGVLKETRNGGSPVALTSTNLQLDATNPIRFAVNGVNASLGGTLCADSDPSQCGVKQCGSSDENCVQPRITMLLNVKIANDSDEPIRTIQTTISQRNLNAKPAPGP